MKSNFKIIAKEGNARAGVLKTAHGEIKTPIYMPVGTQGSVKALSPDDLKDAQAQIILGNTYHLYLRPTSKLIKKMGGLHKFMNWDGPILTDSGGFQAFSLGAMIKDGVRKVPASHKQAGILRSDSSEEGSELLTIRKSNRIYNEKNGKIGRNITVLLQKDQNELSRSKLTGYRCSPCPSCDRAVNCSVLCKNKADQIESILSKITEEGVEFKSHLDGSRHLLTPEKSIQVQLDLGSDIVLVLDELLSPLSPPSYVGQSLKRTHAWELKSLDFFKKNLKKGTNPGAQIFGILQGVYDQKIRENEARWVASQDFSGVSIGGSFGTSKYWPASTQGGEEKEETNWAASKAIYQTMDWVVPNLPEEWPKHALGIGEIRDFFECIERGIDMFDCVAPTRRARNGSLYISPKNGGTLENKFTLSLQKAQFALDAKAIDPGCECYTCQNFSRSYLRHLLIAQELLYFRLASIHNVYFCLHIVQQIRDSITRGEFKKLKNKWLKAS